MRGKENERAHAQYVVECLAVRCSVLECIVALCFSRGHKRGLHEASLHCSVLQCVAVVLQVCCSKLHSVCCSVFQRVAVRCCSALLQCVVAVHCCSVFLTGS